jgi:2-polyprenyl-3-methyl-5-hydroxy-6-metoxy-1,4-benzoquinol methylase
MDRQKVYELARKYKLTQAEINEMAIPSYSHRNPIIRWIFRRRLKELAKLTKFDDKKVLDFGCGIGALFENYKNAKKVYACDIHPEIASENAKKIGLKVKFVKTIDKIPDKELDVAIFADVLEHIKDVKSFLQKVKRKMKDGGAILISLPTESKFYKMCRTIAGYSSKADYHVTDPRYVEALLDGLFEREVKSNLPFIFPLFKIYKYEAA